MQDYLKTLAYWIVGICIIILTVRACKNEKSVVSVGDFKSLPDTIYQDKPLIIRDTVYKYEVLPTQIVYWGRSQARDTIKEIKILRDTIRLFYAKDSLDINSDFLLKYPNTDRLIQLKLDDYLTLNLITPSGQEVSKIWKLDEGYSYNYYIQDMTHQKPKIWKRIHPFGELQIRPFNQMYDLNLGINYNTKGFKYEIGFNLFYYPEIQKGVGRDLFLRLNYTF